MQYHNSIGRPFSSLRCYVVDLKSGKLLPVGIPGELCISGVQGEAGIGNADLDAPLALRAKEFAVSVGSRLEIKWDPFRWAKERGGGCQGTVKAISTGFISTLNRNIAF